MALTEAEVNAAKADAKKYLEFSTQALAFTLGVASDEISSSLVIPVASDHADYEAYDCLKKQATALEALA
jgi:hypothetical protein